MQALNAIYKTKSLFEIKNILFLFWQFSELFFFLQDFFELNFFQRRLRYKASFRYFVWLLKSEKDF